MTRATTEQLHAIDGGNLSKDMWEGIACGVALAEGSIPGAIIACFIIPYYY